MERILIILQEYHKPIKMAKYRFLIVFICLQLVGFGQSKLEAQFTEVKEDALLYRIEGKDVKKQSYILGTMHLIDYDKYFFPEGLSNLIKKQKQIVMELSESPNEFEIMSKLMLPADESLADYFTPEQYDSLKMYFSENLNVDTTMFNNSFGRMKPFVVIQSMSIKPDSTKFLMSIDKTIYKIAEEEDKDVIGLETIDEQLSFFNNMEKDEVNNMVMKSIRETDTSTMMSRMEDAYFSQSLKAIGELLENEDAAMDMDEFLFKRNENWIPLIKNYIAKKTSFIAVGAGHLYGEKGVLELLRKQGYTITGLKMIDKDEK